MPISVVCPGCGAKLNAPDSAAGKRVKCPRPGCGALIEVAALAAAFEVVEESPAPPTPARKKAVAVEPDDEEPRKPKKPVRAAVDDEEDRPTRRKRRRDEDDEDERPARRKKARKSGGSALPLVIAVGVLVALLVVGGVGYGVYALALKDKDETADAGGGGGRRGGGIGGGLFKAAVPPGWVEYTSERDRFKAYFPKKPEVHANLSLDKFKGARPKSVNGYAIGSPSEDLMIMLSVAELNPGTSQADRDALADGFNKKWRAGPGSREGTATWAGRPAKQFLVEVKDPKGPISGGAVVRQMSTDTHLYGVAIVSKTWPVPPDVLNGFFDNFELLD